MIISKNKRIFIVKWKIFPLTVDKLDDSASYMNKRCRANYDMRNTKINIFLTVEIYRTVFSGYLKFTYFEFNFNRFLVILHIDYYNNSLLGYF